LKEEDIPPLRTGIAKEALVGVPRINNMWDYAKAFGVTG
jgi:hypothetical protein